MFKGGLGTNLKGRVRVICLGIDLKSRVRVICLKEG
jgi:hypothetical protein